MEYAWQIVMATYIILRLQPEAKANKSQEKTQHPHQLIINVDI